MYEFKETLSRWQQSCMSATCVYGSRAKSFVNVKDDKNTPPKIPKEDPERGWDKDAF